MLLAIRLRETKLTMLKSMEESYEPFKPVVSKMTQTANTKKVVRQWTPLRQLPSIKAESSSEEDQWSPPGMNLTVN